MISRASQFHEPHVTVEHNGFGLARNAGKAETRSELALVHHAFADQVRVFGVVDD